jgi:hypothetical protein
MSKRSFLSFIVDYDDIITWISCGFGLFYSMVNVIVNTVTGIV